MNSIVIILSFAVLIGFYRNRNAIPEPSTLHPAVLYVKRLSQRPDAGVTN